MANTKIPSELVAINAISGTLIADNAITSVHIAENNITATQIAINAVTALQMADGTITSAKIADGTIVTADIADNQISTAKLVDSSVTQAKIGSGAVVAGSIASGTITSTQMAGNSVSTANVQDNAINLDKMAGITRGSIIYGNAAGNPAYLAAGTNGHVLTSDGTDISWTADTDLFLATAGGTITGDLTISEATPTLKFTDTDNNYDATISGLSGSLVLTADSGAEFGTETIQFHTGGSSTLTLDASQNATFAGNTQAASFTVGTSSAENEALNIIDGGHTGHGASNTRSLASFSENVSGNRAGLWLGSMTNENTAVIGTRTASGNLAIQTYSGGWAERLRITNVGKVGIGTDSPATILDVKNPGDSAYTGGLLIRTGTSTSEASSLYHDNSSATTTVLANRYDNAGAAIKLILRASSGSPVTALTALGSGKVGIGETSPDGLLHLKGGTATGDASHILFENTQGDKVFAIGGGSTGVTNSHLYFRNVTDNTRPMVITDAGNIGIGGIIPVSKLHVDTAPNGNTPVTHIKQDGATNAPTLFIEQVGNGGNSNVNQGLLIKVDGQNTGLGNIIRAIGTNSNLNSGNDIEAFIVKGDGNVGIGTATPSSYFGGGNNLVVKQASGEGGITVVTADNTTGYLLFADGTSGNSAYRGQVAYTHSSDILNLVSSGTMGFKTNSDRGTKMTLNTTGHLTFSPVSGFSGLNNSLLGSSNGYMYAMGGTAGLYLADNSALSNAIGIRNDNYIDFTASGTSILKFDGDGIHFQKTDGQKISAKESIVMQVDADNNTASRVFQVTHGNGKTLLNLHDDYRMEVGTIQFSSTRSAGYSSSNGLGASAGDWVDIAAVPYGRNIATIKLFWDAIYAPSSSHHGNMEFDIGSHYGTSYYYGWDSYINLKASSAHNSFFISEARIITPNGSGATGHFQVKFGKATGTQGTLRAYVTHRDEQCSIDPITPVVNNSRSGTTIAELKLDNRPALGTSRDLTVHGKIRACYQPAFFATMSSALSAPSNLNSDIVFNTEVLDQGACYSGSNGRFTAPCDGVYSFGINLLVYPHTNGVLTPWFYKNGSAYGSTTQQGHEGSSHTGVIRQTIIKLDAGDYVTVRMSLGGGNAGANIYGGQSSFHGHMIG